MDQPRYDCYNLISDVKTFYKVYILLTIIVKFEHGPWQINFSGNMVLSWTTCDHQRMLKGFRNEIAFIFKA